MGAPNAAEINTRYNSRVHSMATGSRLWMQVLVTSIKTFETHPIHTVHSEKSGENFLRIFF